MFKNLAYLVFAFSLSACMGTGPELSVIGKASPMPRGEDVAPPFSFTAFCVRNPGECALPATPEFGAALEAATEATKILVIPQEEEGDFWQSRTEPGPGDCEDFALTMRKILREQFPAYSGAFRIATAFTEQNLYHAVLTVETDHGTIVCDIRYPTCAPWETFPYEWRYREVAGASHWQAIGAPIASAPIAATAASKLQ